MTSFLEKYKRQPKIYIDLPSSGTWYDHTIIHDNKCDELPVYGMNTMDELNLKTPDALFSGEATANIIKSCVPSILDPWKLLSIDVEYLLIAIRTATYGNKLPVNTVCPKCSNSTESDVNLEGLLSSFQDKTAFHVINYNGLQITIRSINYKQSTEISKNSYINQKTLANINNSNLAEEEKDKQKQVIYKQITQLNYQSVLEHIDNISDGTEVENDPNEILAFVTDCDRDFYVLLQDSIIEMNNSWNLPDLTVECAEEGCGFQYKSKLNIDYSSFFAARS